jgi:magnesium transporter
MTPVRESVDATVSDEPVRDVWPSESAGFHIVRAVPRARVGTTCAEVLALVRSEPFDYADVVVVVDDEQRVTGMLSMGDIVACAPDTPLGSLLCGRVGTATPHTDQEQVASLAIENVLGAVPVVDEERRLLGVVPPQALLAVLRREHVEDLHRLTGVLRESAAARDAIEGPPTRRARHRLPWLFVGLAGSGLAALVMSWFEEELEARVAIAFFLPGIVYLADAIGTQTEAIAVRALSFGRVSIGRVSIGRMLAGEMWTGTLIGVALATISGLALWAALQDARLALAVATAVLAAGGIATAIGLLLPWLFHRFGLDPAFGSGPLATVIQDVLSLLVYFASVSVFLGVTAQA